MAASLRIRSSYPRLVHFLMVIAAVLVVALLLSGNAFALSPMPHTTLVFFPDRPLDEGQWSALVAELHRVQPVSAAEIPALSGELEVLRRGDLAAGETVRNAISVFLDGDCTLLPGPRLFVSGALGWVPIIDGRIQSFIHVDCTRIVEMLAPLALGMHSNRRDVVMAEAITRVILHEWAHIWTQSSHHVERGITKSQFQVEDLLSDDEDFRTRGPEHRVKKRQQGL